MTLCNSHPMLFPSFEGLKVEGSFAGGDVSSDGGVQLLRLADRRLGLSAALARVLPDPRDPLKVEHTVRDLLRQRIYGLACGYEDLNDHDTLRDDLCWQSAVERTRALASSPTLCRLEARADRAAAVAMHGVLVEQFIASHAEPPAELVLDFDATDDRVHGMQEGRAFHAYYGDWCFLPLSVFCGERMLCAYLRRSNADAARHAWAVLKLLVTRLRAAWPAVQITLRADSGFCRWKMLRWCERHAVGYIVGQARNARLAALASAWTAQAATQHAATKEKQRLFADLHYAAASWDKERRVILKAEHTAQGSNPRYVVTNLAGDAQTLYDELYCARGEMENRIKEQQLGLFADRTSASAWWSNQFRVLLSAAAYVLLEAIRRLGLAGTELARAQVGTIRLKLLKLGAVIVRNTRRVRLLFSTAYPLQELFVKVAQRLSTA